MSDNRKHVGTLRKIKGLSIFSYNTETGELKQVAVTHGPSGASIICEKNCIYIQALNINNALKKLAKTLEYDERTDA